MTHFLLREHPHEIVPVIRLDGVVEPGQLNADTGK